MRKLVLLSAALCLSACAKTPPVISTPPASCALAIPPAWKAGVDPSPIPADADLGDYVGLMVTPDIADAIGARAQGPWMQGYNNESLGRSLANDRLRDTIWIVENCEARANAARPD